MTIVKPETKLNEMEISCNDMRNISLLIAQHRSDVYINMLQVNYYF